MHSTRNLQSLVPKAGAILTPRQYGATPAPNGGEWPLNADDRTRYYLNRIYPTIQGEGSKAGTPMTIIRLQGCPVGCVFCDTPESWEADRVWTGTSRDIADEVAGYPPRWALITGGEPTWQDLTSLTYDLLDRGIKRALETSGVYPITGVWSWVTVSPKPLGLLPLNPDSLHYADEIKWLIGRADDVEALEEWLDRHRGDLKTPTKKAVRISLQPISCSPKATDLAIAALMKHADWRLSLQTHKMMGVA